jgi:hypothetical protein
MHGHYLVIFHEHEYSIKVEARQNRAGDGAILNRYSSASCSELHNPRNFVVSEPSAMQINLFSWYNNVFCIVADETLCQMYLVWCSVKYAIDNSAEFPNWAVIEETNFYIFFPQCLICRTNGGEEERL